MSGKHVHVNLSVDDDVQDEPKEMMVIEINFVNGTQDDIVVHFGDEPDNLAEVGKGFH